MFKKGKGGENEMNIKHQALMDGGSGIKTVDKKTAWEVSLGGSGGMCVEGGTRGLMRSLTLKAQTGILSPE